MKLRHRDYAAAILSFLLTRLVWNDNGDSESWQVSMKLAFYTEFPSQHEGTQVAKPVPLDMDGDGTIEGLVVPRPHNSSNLGGEWGIHILDLKPLHVEGNSLPFYPTLLFSSFNTTTATATARGSVPIKISTGQIILTQKNKHVSLKSKPEDGKGDRNRHYYCGKTWHDASDRCHKHCPSGTPSECGEGQSCFADTSCDILATTIPDKQTYDGLVKTKTGGLPSIVTVWNDGSMTLHCVTGNLPRSDNDSNTEQNTTKQTKQNKKELELRQMWRTNLFPVEEQELQFEELNVLLDSTAPIGQYGVIVVAGRHRRRHANNHEEDERLAHKKRQVLSVYHAIDAVSGTIIWSNTDDAISKDRVEKEAEKNTNRISSSARRRSGLFSSAEYILHKDGVYDESISQDCLAHYRHWILHPSSHALPHFYASHQDAELSVTHFDRRRHYGNRLRRPGGSKNQRSADKRHEWIANAIGSKNAKTVLEGTSRRSQHDAKLVPADPPSLTYARPNIVLSHDRDGISALSLRNGRPICHLSLLPNGLYADINNDGTIDHVQVITNTWIPSSEHASSQNNEIVQNLTKRVLEEGISDQDTSKKRATSQISQQQLCHALALSGIPAREEIFSASLCSSVGRSKAARHAASNSGIVPDALSAAPPLLVEGRSSNSDIVFALNNGIVSRYDAHGRMQWKNAPEGLPTWRKHNNDDDESSTAYLGRVDISHGYSNAARPILVSGDNGMTILSSEKGQVLATTSFPQSAIYRPILADVSGDGVTDVMVLSTDAVWGYKITVQATGGSTFLKIMVGLLLLGIGVGALWNKFGQVADTRSTD